VIAGINSFGYGGANAHVIIEQSPRLGVERELANPQAAVVLPLSAATTAALEGRKSDLAEYDFGSTNILDLAYTLGSRRTNFQNRGYVLASTATGLGETFKTKNLVTGSASSTVAEQPLAFIFTGQGSQWAGMCKELFQFPVFSEAFEEMDKALQSIAEAPSWTLKEAVLDTSNPDLINTPQRSQPCCTAVQVALIQLLASWGIVPSKTIGHSSGEIAAAFAAGHLSAAESIVIAYYRGYCVSKRTSDGAMMAAGLSEADAVSKIAEAGLDGQIRVACVNSPEGVTISGDNSAIDSIVSILSGNGTFARKLKTGGQAYHSQHMLPIGQEYQDFLEKTIPTLGASTTLAKRAVVVSSVTADLKSSGFGPSYWRSNLEGQVKFAQAIKRLHADGLHTFVELGPHTSMELPVKQSLAKEGVAGSEVLYLGPIKRSTDAIETSLTVPAKLWLAGYEVDWNLVNGLSEAPAGTFEVVTELPRYRFQYTELLWSEGRPSIEYRQRKHTRHELLGTLIPGGNGDDLIFRNIVQLSDIKWLEDHRLEETPVFPGTGYLGTAMEAVMRAADIPISEKPTFTFSNVHVLNALTIPTEAAAKIELFTSLHKSNITNSATSSKWWDFIISTFQEGSSVQHAKGSVSVTTEDVPLQSKYQSSTAALEPTAKRTWYNQLIKGGLNYGPLFQPITEFSTPSMTSSPFTSAKLPLITACGDDLAVYPVHPITLDAMLQAAIVSTAKGLPSELKAKVPTRFGTLTIKTGTDGPATIYAASQSVGFGAVETHSEIVDASGQVVVQFDNVRMTPYSSGAPVDSDGERHPMLRNLWKPDLYGLGFISVSDFQKHMDQFVAEADSPLDDDSLIRLGAALDLAVHKNARVRVLELGNDVHDISLAVLDLLASKSDFKRAANYTTASFTESGALSGGLVDLETGERSDAEELSGEKYDIVLIPVAGAWIEQNAGKIEELLEDDATILALAPTSAASAFKTSALTAQAYPIHSGENSVVVARKNIPTEQSTKLEKYLIVERNGQSALGFGLENALSGKLVHRVQLQDLTEELVSNKPIIFNLVEAKDPLLSVINDEEMPKVKLMTDNAGTIVWVTNGNLTQGERPDFALISGLARALSLEQPALKLYVYDIDTAEPSVPETTEKLMTVLNQFSRYPDIEFAQRGNLVHVSRFVPDDGLNTAFRSKQGLHLDSLALKDAGEVRLDIAQAGQYDSIFFKAQESTESIPSTHIRIKVASAGINAKDYYLLGGKVDVENATPSLEYAGTVEEVGQDVTNFTAGDKVVVMAPSHFQNYQTIPEWAAVKLEDGEDMNVAATLPVVWATAIYALHNRASIQEGESVLIHSGAGGVGIAAIQIAQQAGAEVFTTVSTEEKKQYLVNTFGLNPENVFSSRGDSFLAGILEKTGGRGVDVVLNSLTGDQLHATWRAIADSGRFVEIGKMDLTNAGRLEMDQFLKNTTFTAFDLTHLYTSTNPKQNAIWHQLLEQTVQLWRSGKLAGLEDTLQVFDIADTVAAYRRFSSRNRMGKVAINFQNGDSKISGRSRPYPHPMDVAAWR
jgi:acyl transferase domain-containing protein/NADPH:quinone reductase-like Zn-dependent oxidoreductase